MFLKIEGANPTGSFKDRGMAVAMACAVGRGARAVVCASTGNTAASAAAYAARAGIEALILHPAGAVAGAKLAQTRVVGAAVVPIEGTFDDALRLAQEAADHGYIVVNSGFNPDRIAGQRTAVYEIVETLGLGARHPRAALRRRRQHRCLPVGLRGGGRGAADRVRRGARAADDDRDGDPHRRAGARADVADANAEVVTLSDDEILAAWSDLARLEGVFCEPSSAAGLAALRSSRPPAGSTVVCVLTGSGLKDIAAVDALVPPRLPARRGSTRCSKPRTRRATRGDT